MMRPRFRASCLTIRLPGFVGSKTTRGNICIRAKALYEDSLAYAAGEITQYNLSWATTSLDELIRYSKDFTASH